MSHNYNNETLLEMIELYAEEVGNIASEQELSDVFDRDIAPLILDIYDADDHVAFSEAFNNWTDMLCKEGEIHPEQYSNYCYVGEHS